MCVLFVTGRRLACAGRGETWHPERICNTFRCYSFRDWQAFQEFGLLRLEPWLFMNCPFGSRDASFQGKNWPHHAVFKDLTECQKGKAIQITTCGRRYYLCAVGRFQV